MARVPGVLCVEISPESMELLLELTIAAGYERISGFQKVLDKMIREEYERKEVRHG